MTTTRTKRLSDAVLQCEHRAAWRDVERDVRVGGMVTALVSRRAAVLDDEMRARGLAVLP